ncbi:SGNH/GDSL hydrolase family protein [Terasakiella pusilla]|uniref:SGNH/GDSL hydrolase family protein n=1 Tax=Terasakiella pusilla TaxID=64973 RepID=UPI003AA9AA23
MSMRVLLKNVGLMGAGVVLAFLVGEGVVRVNTANQENYAIEMWRYAKTLKVQSQNEEVGHVHLKNAAETLQNVEIRTNSLGLRGGEPNREATYRVAVVGDSLALGWGVPEEQTLSGQLQAQLGPEADVINVGVGNRNVEQSVSHWLDVKQQISADALVVLVGPRAPVDFTRRNANFLVEQSQLFALVSTSFQQIFSGEFGENALVEGYRRHWQSEEGQKVLKRAFDKLATVREEDGTDIVILSIPEPHDFNNYKFGFIGQKTQELSQAYGFKYVDPLPSLEGPPSEEFWVSENDLHFNGRAFEIVAQDVLPYLKGKNQ